MFGLWKGKKEGPEVQDALQRISLEQMVVRMEVERLLLRFNTRIVLRDQMVLAGKPLGMDDSLRVGDQARLRIPWARGFEVRMEVTDLHVTLKAGKGGFVCRMPVGHALPIKRQGERFNTSRFSNVRLRLPSVGLDFPVVDLSSEGCRVLARSQLGLEHLRVNRKISEGIIQVGDRFHIPLQSVVPRARTGDRVGMAFKPQSSQNTKQALKTLLGVLAMQEVESLGTALT